MVDYGPWMSMVALTRSIQFVYIFFLGRSWISFQAIGNWNFVRLMRPIAECHRVKLVISSCSTWGRSWNASRRHRNNFFWSACQTCFTCLSVITCEIRDLKLTGTLEAFRDVDGSVTWSLIGHVELCFFFLSGGLFAVILFFPGLTIFFVWNGTARHHDMCVVRTAATLRSPLWSSHYGKTHWRDAAFASLGCVRRGNGWVVRLWSH